jgi:hypothetical protein
MTNHCNSSEQVLNYLIGKDSEHRLRKGGYIISQKIKFFITTAVRSSKPTQIQLVIRILMFSPIQIFQTGNKVEDLLSVIVN